MICTGKLTFWACIQVGPGGCDVELSLSSPNGGPVHLPILHPVNCIVQSQDCIAPIQYTIGRQVKVEMPGVGYIRVPKANSCHVGSEFLLREIFVKDRNIATLIIMNPMWKGDL